MSPKIFAKSLDLTFSTNDGPVHALKDVNLDMDIVSGAGHDACWINDIAPTAMIMCPCVDGLSHNEAEEISKDWAQAGTDVLLHAVLNTAIIQ